MTSPLAGPASRALTSAKQNAPPAAGRSQEPARGTYLQSLQRGVAVLDLISQSVPGISAREIADRTGLDPAVAHRILRTLARDDLVVKTSGRYTPGPRTLLLGNRYLAQTTLRATALPYQIDLLHRTFAGRPWRVAVLTPAGPTMTLVSEIWSPTAPLDSLAGILTRPIDQAASGRCVLAYLPEREVVSLIGEALAAELAPRFAAIRDADGVDYISAAEHPPGFASGLSLIAGLIRHRDGRPAGGLVVSGPDLEQHAARESEVACQVLRSAKQTGRMLP